MSKKNKDLEVMEKSVTIQRDGKSYSASEFWLGKKCMGTIVDLDGNFEVTVEPEKTTMRVRNFSDGIEYLLKEWNLHQ